MTNQSIASLYQFVLQQVAAEAYVDNGFRTDETRMRGVLVELGNNRAANQLGMTKLTRQQFDEFWARYEIVHQLSDNPSDSTAEQWAGIALNTGFSATLLFDRQTGQYTFAIRSTESKLIADGGDRERDAYGADAAIATAGFAFAQIDTMERYYSWLRSSGVLPAGQKINVTGYSLGGHLATVFTEMHAADVLQTVTFNGAGRGTWTQAAGSLTDMVAFYRAVLADPDAYIPLLSRTYLKMLELLRMSFHNCAHAAVER